VFTIDHVILGSDYLTFSFVFVAVVVFLFKNILK
jgi:hypothetical protein